MGFLKLCKSTLPYLKKWYDVRHYSEMEETLNSGECSQEWPIY